MIWYFTSTMEITLYYGENITSTSIPLYVPTRGIDQGPGGEFGRFLENW